jgi:predicted N-acetyltransferase YhbS
MRDGDAVGVFLLAHHRVADLVRCDGGGAVASGSRTGMTPTVRAVRRSELSQVYDLLALAFGQKDAPLVRFAAQTEQDSTFRLRHGRVAVLDGRVVGYVRIFARTMLLRGVTEKAGGIGSVATHPEARHGGIATVLLQDAIAQMRREEMHASFLFTGIPGFYERLGYRIVREPSFEANAAEVEAVPHAGLWDVRSTTEGHVPQLLAIYRRAIVGSTGAIVRSARTWRDAQSWLDEDADGCFVAERNGIVVSYVRSRRRAYGRQVLEAECMPGHEGAIMVLLAAVGHQAAARGERKIVALAPEGHTLATVLRSLPSTSETTDVDHPMMVLNLSGDPEIDAAFNQEPLHFWNSDRI